MELTIDRMHADPYRAGPGPELDALIHERLMKLPCKDGRAPAYSADTNLAKRVLTKLKMGQQSVIVGRTSLEGRTWFARYERNEMDGTEVFADSFELAICRLALLRIADSDPAP